MHGRTVASTKVFDQFEVELLIELKLVYLLLQRLLGFEINHNHGRPLLMLEAAVCVGRSAPRTFRLRDAQFVLLFLAAMLGSPVWRGLEKDCFAAGPHTPLHS